MPRESHRLIGEPLVAETGLVRRDELMLAEELDDRQRRERNISRLRLLWEHRRILFKIIALGFVCSLLIALLIPSRYESTTSLMPPDQSGNMGILSALLGKAGDSGGSGGLAGLAGDVLGLKTSADLFLGVLASRTVQDDLVTKFDLRKVYGVRTWEAAREKVKDYTSLASDRKSGIITIKVTDRSPQRASAMAQEYVAELNLVVTHLNTSSAHRERVFLEGRLAEVERDLESAETDFSRFASKNTAINIPEQGKAMIAAAADLQGELIAAQTQVESLRQIYTDDNVRVREAQAQVDELRRQLGKISGKPGGDTAPSGGEAQSEYPAIRELPVLGVTYADLYRRTKVEEAVFASLTQEYELAKVQEAKETPSVKVLDAADIPEKKSFPPRGIISVAGALLFGGLGAVWILGRENWQQVDSQSSGKRLAREVFNDVRAVVPWHLGNGPDGVRCREEDWPRIPHAGGAGSGKKL
jgi:capsule polysaccharide export protein KpsE/RkpR